VTKHGVPAEKPQDDAAKHRRVGPMANIRPIRFMILFASSPLNWSRTNARESAAPAATPMP
jgi:hypothetical protein